MDSTYTLVNYPNVEQIQNITKELQPLQFLSDSSLLVVDESSVNWIKDHEISIWKEVFASKLVEVERSLVYLIHFKYLGINDSRWVQNERGKVRYLPDFGRNDYLHKDFFDFYVDVFFSKGFSSLEILAHIVFKSFNINGGDKKISFFNAISGLVEKDSSLHFKISEITNSIEFRKGKKFRNDLIHNYPGTKISSPFLTNVNKTVVINGEKFRVTESLGVDNLRYTASDEVVTICKGFWSSLLSIVTVINEHYEKSTKEL